MLEEESDELGDEFISHFSFYFNGENRKSCYHSALILYYSAFTDIVKADENEFEHVYRFYDQVMQGDSSYSERECCFFLILQLLN